MLLALTFRHSVFNHFCLLSVVFILAACGGSGSDPVAPAPSEPVNVAPVANAGPNQIVDEKYRCYTFRSRC